MDKTWWRFRLYKHTMLHELGFRICGFYGFYDLCISLWWYSVFINIKEGTS